MSEGVGGVNEGLSKLRARRARVGRVHIARRAVWKMLRVVAAEDGAGRCSADGMKVVVDECVRKLENLAVGYWW